MKRFFTFGVMVVIIIFVSSSLGWSKNYPRDEKSWAILVEVSDYTDERISDIVLKDNILDELKNVLVEVGGYNPEHIQILRDGQNSLAEIRNAIASVYSKISNLDSFIFYFRGHITKPRGSNAINIFPQDAKEGELDSYIKDSQLNRWFANLKAKDKIVILDCYTDDENIDTYRVNRETVGTAAIFSAQPIASITSKPTFSDLLLKALKAENTDSDENRVLTVGEVYEYIYNNWEWTGVLAPTDDMNAGIMKLPSMLQVKTDPPGASLFINGKKSGLTPVRIIDGLKKGVYTVKVEMPLYIIPDERSGQIKQLRGEAANFPFSLIPIKVYGKVLDQQGKAIERTSIYIDGTKYSQKVAADGSYSFENWKPYGLLEAGKSYTLKAESDDELYYGTNSFTFEGNQNIQRDVTLIKRSWYQVAQLRFDRKDYQKAAEAFHLGVDESTTLPDISPEFAKILFSYFTQLVELQPQNLNYLIVTAKLSDKLNLRTESKIYWRKVRDQSKLGSAEHAQAEQRLKELSPIRLPIIIAVSIILILIVLSAWRIIRGRGEWIDD